MVTPARRSSSASYEQRRPTETVLYGSVADHLETFLAEAREQHERGLPHYVEQEFRTYLKCGIHAHGFLRARCSACGRDLLVAFSCKRRGVCPSCNARRMCDSAALITDRVLPQVPVRQWVLSVPFEPRLLLARNPRALSAVGRLFVREISHWQREQAGLSGIRDARTGAICFPQRFGGSLNLNVHYHVAVPDGVFTCRSGDDRTTFHLLPRPTHDDLDALAFNVEMRVLAWLRRRSLLSDGEDRNGAEPVRSAIDACLEGSLGIGELAAPADGGEPATEEALPRATKSQRRAGRSRGFDIHAGVFVSASDREGRERLLRYCARSPLSLERLSQLKDGRLAYALRKPWGKQTHRIMRPTEFLARLSALIPPPRHPLVRFHGVFAPHSAWRKRIVPRKSPHVPEAPQSPRAAVPAEPAVARGPGRGPARPPKTSATTIAASQPAPPRAPVCDATASRCRRSERIDWAELLKRVYAVDALACPCGRLRFIALILDADAAAALLQSLGRDASAPPIARARSPDLVDPNADG